jgi:fructosamine-3-kinase
VRPPERVAGRAVTAVRRVAGGDINEAFAVELEDGARAFVKTRADAAPGEFAAEAEGLGWLAAPGALRTPRVLDVAEAWLALEWIDAGALDAAGEEELGRGLALTHATGAETYGAGNPLRFGALELSNEARATFAAFYAENRLAPLVPRAGLSERGAAAVGRVIERIEDLAGPPEPPARVHGDLWSGNVLAGADGRPWLIDPVAHGGHREVDLATLELFGAPSVRTTEAYREVAPLAEGARERVPLWQLFPLLVHAALFGGGYVARAEATATALT